LYTINPPPEEYNHNAGSPLDARVRTVNTCDDDKENTKSRLDTSADNNAPGVNDTDDGGVAVVGATVVVVLCAVTRTREFPTTVTPPGIGSKRGIQSPPGASARIKNRP
jgi:hypothetical protein